MTESGVPAEPIPFRLLLDEAMKLTRRYFGAIYLSVAIPLALLACLATLAQLRYMANFAAVAGNPRSMLGQGCAVFLVTVLVWLTLRGLASGVITAAAVDGVLNRPIAIGAKWAFILQPAALGTLLLALLAIAAGFCLLVIPGIYIGLSMSFLIPVMAAEGLRGGAAMTRSWRLVRYNPHKRFLDNTMTKIFLLSLVAGLIGYAIAFLVQLPFTALAGVRMARRMSAGQAGAPMAFTPDYWVQVPSAILSSLVSTAVAIYTSFGIVLLYIDVVRRKEGSDLAAAIDARFGGGERPTPPPPGVSPA